MENEVESGAGKEEFWNYFSVQQRKTNLTAEKKNRNRNFLSS